MHIIEVVQKVQYQRGIWLTSVYHFAQAISKVLRHVLVNLCETTIMNSQTQDSWNVFSLNARFLGIPTVEYLDMNAMQMAHSYFLFNCEGIKQYLEQVRIIFKSM